MAFGSGARGERRTAKVATGTRAEPIQAGISFPAAYRIAVSGHVVGDLCFDCECRVVEIGGPGEMRLAWCECVLPEDHAEMEVF
jgi:hypothetical protein